MVCVEGWISTLQIKTWAGAVVIKVEFKPSLTKWYVVQDMAG